MADAAVHADTSTPPGLAGGSSQQHSSGSSSGPSTCSVPSTGSAQSLLLSQSQDNTATPSASGSGSSGSSCASTSRISGDSGEFPSSDKTEEISPATATVPLNDDVVDGPDAQLLGDEEPEPAIQRNWGRLIPLNERLFNNVTLNKNEYVFGRGTDCDYIFHRHSFKKYVPLYTSLSKKHFRIFKENHNSRDLNSYTVFLEDLSHNGTFINGQRVGENKKRVLENNSEISLSLMNNKAFLFFDMGESQQEQERYPSDLKEKYTISKVIGVGACGEVRLAFEIETGKQFAVKIISKKKFSVSSKVQSSIISEVDILRRLKHPGIIEIGDVYDSDDALYIFLELVVGGELFEQVKSLGRLDEETSKIIFYQMLLAVDYLHKNGITHRDLKPENVLLVSDDLRTGIKITDFGLSRFVGEHSLMKTLCGTPNYLAPEVLKSAGMGGYSKVVDCWSLGCILYICLSGSPPFADEVNGMSIYQQVLIGYYNFPKKIWGSISPEAIDLVKKLINIDEKKRLTVAEALEHPWLQDEDMKKLAKRLMNGEKVPSTEMLPPPIIPAARKSSSEDSDSPAQKKAKIEEKIELGPSSSTGF